MNLSRLSKKSPHTDSRETLMAIHNKKMEYFQKKYEKIPEKKKLLKQLIIQYYGDMTYSDRKDLYKIIQEHQKELIKLKNREEECMYLLKASPFLKKYYEEEIKYKNPEKLQNIEKSLTNNYSIENFINKKVTNKKGEIKDNYIKEVIVGDHTNVENNILVCSHCNENLIIIEKEGAASCPNCSIQIKYSDNTNIKEFMEEIEITTQFSYKKINHFKEWLSTLQAQESTVVDNNVIKLLLIELKKEKIYDEKYITHDRIKKYLKKLNLVKHKEYISTIINKLCGRKPPTISKELEEKLIEMFQQIQEPFKKVKPKDRKNFMSYSYTFHKMCQILGEHELLQYFPLLKSRDKLYVQDKIWKDICNLIGWKFIASV